MWLELIYLINLIDNTAKQTLLIPWIEYSINLKGSARF